MLNTDEIKNYNKLSEIDKKRFQKKFHEDDLSYLTSFAIESGTISSADIEELNVRIDSKTKTGFNKNYLNTFVALVCGIFIGATLLFGWLESTKNHESRFEAIAKKTEMPIIAKQPENPTLELHKKERTEYPKEHFSIDNSVEQIANVIDMPETIETKTLSGLNIGPIENNEINLRYLPNAPVIFIKDLKVACYNSYYFKNNQSIDIQTGLSAEFSDKFEKENSALAKKHDNNYYAHQIIKDAIILFSSKNYNGSIDLLELLYKFNKKDVNCQFYLGMSYYYLNNFTKAKGFFEEVLDNDINIFEQESEFYKAMSLNNTQQKEEAKEMFRLINSRKGFYSERAGEVLKKSE